MGKLIKKIAAITVFIVLLVCFSISASALENNDVLINNSEIYLTTGDSWSFYQGYELVFKGLSSSQGENKVWIELLLNNESVDDTIIREGEYFVYTHNSKEIFNITVDTIYSGSSGGLAIFKPVYQYLDPTLPKPDMTQDHGIVGNSNGSMNNFDSQDGGETESISGFSAALLFLCISTVAAIFNIRLKKEK